MDSGVDAPELVVVVPTYNEAETLPELVAQLAELKMPELHILVVDDNSPDGTGRIADELATTYPWIDVLHRARKEGLGRSYVAGMKQALEQGAHYVGQMDADLSHPAASLPIMLKELQRTDSALVIGSRYTQGGALAADWPLRRRLLSRGANSYVERVLHLGLSDATAGFMMWQSDALREVDLDTIASDGYAFTVEMKYRAVALGLPVIESPITFFERTHGESKMSLAVQWESVLMPWRLRRTRKSLAAARPAVQARLHA